MSDVNDIRAIFGPRKVEVEWNSIRVTFKSIVSQDMGCYFSKCTWCVGVDVVLKVFEADTKINSAGRRAVG